jgi:hypothetical protein
LAVGDRTDVQLQLDPPATFRTLRGATVPVSTVHLAADRADERVAALRENVMRARSTPYGNSLPSGSEADASKPR